MKIPPGKSVTGTISADCSGGWSFFHSTLKQIILSEWFSQMKYAKQQVFSTKQKKYVLKGLHMVLINTSKHCNKICALHDGTNVRKLYQRNEYVRHVFELKIKNKKKTKIVTKIT